MNQAHGSIRLLVDDCTACLICVRECPTWCIQLTSHQERSAPAPGARERTREVLDDFWIDWSLCMYCGICIEQCPTNALEWQAELIPGAEQLAELRHDSHNLGSRNCG